MNKQFYLLDEDNNRTVLNTKHYSTAANKITVKYLGTVSVGAKLYSKISEFSRIIKTEEDQKEYINNIAMDILEKYPIYQTNTHRIINHHKRKFVLYVLKNNLQKSLDKYIDKLMSAY